MWVQDEKQQEGFGIKIQDFGNAVLLSYRWPGGRYVATRVGRGTSPAQLAQQLTELAHLVETGGQPPEAGLVPRAEETAACWCKACQPLSVIQTRMIVCPVCGNKRCPRATFHENACTGSNEPGQKGSSWEGISHQVRQHRMKSMPAEPVFAWDVAEALRKAGVALECRDGTMRHRLDWHAVDGEITEHCSDFDFRISAGSSTAGESLTPPTDADTGD